MVILEQLWLVFNNNIIIQWGWSDNTFDRTLPVSFNSFYQLAWCINYEANVTTSWSSFKTVKYLSYFKTTGFINILYYIAIGI